MTGPAANTWLGVLAELRAAGTGCAVVVVTESTGSVPREPGARMIVTREGLCWGTIGGGNLEHQAIEHARGLIGARETVSETVDYPLSEKVGQCCGGQVKLFYETFPWTRRKLAIFGAGHVAQAVAGLGAYLDVDIEMIDTREESEIQPPLPQDRTFELLSIDAPEEEVDRLPAGSLVLVMTSSHALDLEVIARAALRDDLAYLGLIGSTRKWERFQKRLIQRGLTEAELARVRCPIGVHKASKEPRAIALSVAAELSTVT